MQPILKATAVAIVPALAALLSAGAAQAAYGINVNSTASAGGIYEAGSGTCSYGGSGGTCSQGEAHYGGAHSANISPTGGDGTATLVTAAEYGAGAGASATSRTSVDLSTGSIHLYGADSNVTSNCSTPLACGGTSNYGAFSDVLHFTVLGADANTVTAIQLTFSLDGSMINQFTATDAYASGEIFGGLNFGGSDARFDLKSNAGTGYLTQVGYLDTYPSGYPGIWTTNAGHTANVYTETYNLTGASGDIAVALNANLSCNEGYVCDFENTARLALALPTGVSYTSDSGVFLTGAGAPGGVPEPATWSLMLIGFGGLGSMLRRRGWRAGLAPA